jgi:predicted dehydrogenase
MRCSQRPMLAESLLSAWPLEQQLNMHPSQKIPAAVIGVGYLGKFHAEKYAASEKADLVAVVDEDSARAAEIGAGVGAVGLTDYRELFGRVQCVSIAVPTRVHHQVAKDFITAGIDVLVEKPLAANLDEAKDLVTLAESRNCILQVGHLERFNPAIRRLEGVIKEPKFVECHRLAPFVERGYCQLSSFSGNSCGGSWRAGSDRNTGHCQCPADLCQRLHRQRHRQPSLDQAGTKGSVLST